jgi:hypothetical protein
MNQTESKPSSRLAGALFDEVIAPLAEARRIAGEIAVARGRDPGAVTYFTEPRVRTMKTEDFETHGDGSVDGLLAALAAYWAKHNEPALAALIPRMKAIGDALRTEKEQNDGNIDVLCYTLF